ncbi:acyclic terpene utilization AtuA family protein [Bradyrhizobium sp.]|uniref:acyclic terpene utilization AtuA family protein n=1 Tax=Bradyrhizobium sp. TaxID=376 RepID=UPI0039E34D79
MVGCGAGFSQDRVGAAVPVVDTLIARRAPAAIIFEMLAERTLAAAHLDRLDNPDRGYEPTLAAHISPILEKCLANGITIVGNFGAANPKGAAAMLTHLAEQAGLPAPRIAVIGGDDLSDHAHRQMLREQLGKDFSESRFVCANVYQGAFEIAEGIRGGAQIVVTGRVADASLTLGPAIAHYGWKRDDWDKLAGGTMAGHILECGAQVTGGYYADPGPKDVPDLDRVGFPIVEITPEGDSIVTKADDTGGIVNAMTVKEQLLYEVHDPFDYLTPDVRVDLSDVEIKEVGPDKVLITGVKGRGRPETLKVNAFFKGGWLGEGEISYAGPNAEARARLAMDILRKRLGNRLKLRFDLIGVTSLFDGDDNDVLAKTPDSGSKDVRLRVAAKDDELAPIEDLIAEVVSLWTCGPAGGGGARGFKRSRLSMSSCLIPRDLVPAHCSFYAT